jgi:hypothetical protein
MRTSQYILLAFSVTGGIIWIFLIQNFLFSDPLAGFLSQKSSNRSFVLLWISCLIGLMAWLFFTIKSKTRNADEVMQMRSRWWLTAMSLIGLGWFYQWLILRADPLPPEGWFILLLFVPVDVLLLFWIPTLLASPGSYRYVVPGAVKLLGGR